MHPTVMHLPIVHNTFFKVPVFAFVQCYLCFCLCLCCDLTKTTLKCRLNSVNVWSPGEGKGALQFNKVVNIMDLIFA